MLAYLFWHEPGPGVDPDRYVDLLRAFHAALRAAPPPSFVRSWSVRLEQAPWDGGPAQPFEDWYLVDDWAAAPCSGGRWCSVPRPSTRCSPGRSPSCRGPRERRAPMPSDDAVARVLD